MKVRLYHQRYQSRGGYRTHRKQPRRKYHRASHRAHRIERSLPYGAKMDGSDINLTRFIADIFTQSI
jgi:hypothetical protein